MIDTLIAPLKCNDNGEPIIEAVWSTIYRERILALSHLTGLGAAIFERNLILVVALSIDDCYDAYVISWWAAS